MPRRGRRRQSRKRRRRRKRKEEDEDEDEEYKEKKKRKKRETKDGNEMVDGEGTNAIEQFVSFAELTTHLERRGADTEAGR